MSIRDNHQLVVISGVNIELVIEFKLVVVCFVFSNIRDIIAIQKLIRALIQAMQ